MIRRSEATRQRILEAAQRRFAEQGYDRTTIRAIAADAQIAPAMVIRYFRSKDQLFSAATQIDLKIRDITGVPPELRGETIVARILDRWEGPDAGEELPIMLRAAACHEGARDKYLDAMQRQIRPMLATICPAERLDLCLALVTTQLAGLVFTRYVIRVPAVVALDRAYLIRRIGKVVQHYLTVED